MPNGQRLIQETQRIWGQKTYSNRLSSGSFPTSGSRPCPLSLLILDSSSFFLVMNSVRSPDSGSKLLTALIEKYRNTEREGKTDLFTVLVKSEYRETLNRSLPRSYQRGSLQQKRHKGQEIGIWRQSCSWEIRILVSGFLQAAHLHSSWNFPWGILTPPSYNMTLHMFFSL